MMATPTFKMLWLSMVIAGLAVLVAGAEMNRTSTASPKVQVSMENEKTINASSTTQPPAPFAAVMDLFQAPLAAFKQPEMDDKIDMPMGRDVQNGASTPAPSNIFFRAGNGLGSAASSLTGWFNNRMIPQALRPSSSTTAAPQVFAIIPNQQVRRKVIGNRQRPVQADSDNLEEDEEEVNDDGNEEENFNSNNDRIEDDDEDDYEPIEKRKGYNTQTQKRPNRQYFYIEEELAENDDIDYDVQIPLKKTQRKQPNTSNKRRKTSPKKEQQKRRKPVRKVQNPQRVQYVQSRPAKTQSQRKRRPAVTYELVPISPNQAMNSIQKKKPSSTTQNNQQRPGTQFFSIPWSRLGFAGPPKEPTSNEQQSKPIIVRIPQQNIKRKRRPAKKPSSAEVVKQPKRKPLRGQVQNQSPVFSILSQEQIREILKTQLNQPSKTRPQTSNLPVTLDVKKKPPKKESQEVPSNNNDTDEPQQKPQTGSEAENQEEDTNSFIVVGPTDDDDDADDKEIDLNLYRHNNNRRGFTGGRAAPRLSHNWQMDDDNDDYDE